MRLVELGGAVQRHLRPDRLEALPEGGAPERVVGRLQLLGVGGVPPHHQVGVGAQAAHVVEPADHHVLLGQHLEERLDVGRLRRPVGVAEDVAELEHRPHRVADGVVELSGPRGVGHLGAHGAHSARVTEATARRADPITAGMPTPSYAAPQTASPGWRATAARILATRSRWPTAYCGSAPPHRCTCVSTGSRGDAGHRREVGERDPDQPLVRGLERRLLAVPPERGAQDDDVRVQVAHPGPLGEGERRRLDGAPLDRRHEEARALEERVRHVLRRGRPGSRPRRSPPRSPPAPPRRRGRRRPAAGPWGQQASRAPPRPPRWSRGASSGRP